MNRFCPFLLVGVALLFAAGGCVNPVFTAPVSLSTRPVPARHVTPLGPVSVQRTAYLFVIIPVVPDPRKGFDLLLAEAKAAGGDAVIDVQVANSGGFFWIIPPIQVIHWTYSGTAVRTGP